jgi:hypothetical protein
MYSPFVLKLSKQTGKTKEEIQELWSEAKQLTSDKFSISESDFENDHYDYSMTLVKNMIDVKEHGLEAETFLNSDLSVEQYLEVMTSTSLSSLNKDTSITVSKDIDKPLKKKPVKKDDDEEENFKIKTKQETYREDDSFRIDTKKEKVVSRNPLSQFGIENSIDLSEVKEYVPNKSNEQTSFEIKPKGSGNINPLDLFNK